MVEKTTGESFWDLEGLTEWKVSLEHWYSIPHQSHVGEQTQEQMEKGGVWKVLRITARVPLKG